MQTETPPEVSAAEAIEQLSRSARGRDTIRALLAWLDDSGLGLDCQSQQATLDLIVAAWELPGTVRDLMREVEL